MKSAVIREIRLCYLVLCVVVLLGAHVGCQDATRGIALDISFSDSSVVVNGTEFRGPIKISQLEEVLGAHDRKFELNNDVYVWDQYGIYANTRTAKAMVTSLTVAYESGDLEYSPQKKFGGKVTISGTAFGQRTAQKHFVKNGFTDSGGGSCKLEMGRRSITVDHNESLSKIQRIVFALK